MVFALNYFFQLYRGSKQDIAIFTIAFILMILESTNYLDLIPEFKWMRYAKFNEIILIGFGIYLLLTRRGFPLTIWLFIALFVLMFLDLWRRFDGDGKKMSKANQKSVQAWAGIGVALCTWEFIAFVLASISKDDFSYPTISVLIAPHLDALIGRAIFIVAWILFGFLLLKDWREPS